MAYYVFEDNIMAYRNRIVHARLEKPYPRYEPHWWAAQPLQAPLPELTFTVTSAQPLLDNFFTGHEFALYSARLMALLRGAGVRCEDFPARLVHRRTGELIADDYRVFHLLELEDALDPERSDIEERGSELIIRRLVLRRDDGWARRPLFRLGSYINFVLMREDLKARLDECGITGCRYTPLAEFQFLSRAERMERAWQEADGLRAEAEQRRAETERRREARQKRQPAGKPAPG